MHDNRRQNSKRANALAVLMVGLVLPLSAHAQTDATRAGPALKGQLIVEANCSRCHAVGRDGTSTHSQAPPFRDIVKRYAPSDLAEALAEGIVSGHPDMPQFVFQPGEINAIIAYLDALKAPQEK